MLLTINQKEEEKQLRRKSTPIEEVGELSSIIEELGRVLNEEKGQGIAAPQIGELVRLIIIKYQGRDLVVINPILKHKKGAQKVVERCLSIPDRWFEVKRPISMTLFGTRMDGRELKIKCDDWLSSVVEHEIDHLDGVLIDKKGREVGVDKRNEPIPYPKLAYG